MKLFCNEFTKLTLHRRQTPHAAQTGGMGGARGSRSQTRLSTVTLNGPSDRGRFSNRQSSQGTRSLTIRTTGCVRLITLNCASRFY